MIDNLGFVPFAEVQNFNFGHFESKFKSEIAKFQYHIYLVETMGIHCNFFYIGNQYYSFVNKYFCHCQLFNLNIILEGKGSSGEFSVVRASTWAGYTHARKY